MSSEKKKKLLEQLEALKIFPKNKIVKELSSQIKKKLEKLEKRETPKKTTVSTEEKKSIANKTRSGKLRRYHNYIRLAFDFARVNFPDITYAQVRKQLSERRQGKEVRIPDAIWDNVSQ